jgi:hypothetical protein
VDQYKFKSILMPVVNLSAAEIEAYEKNPANKPKIDFRPRGIRPQLSTKFYLGNYSTPKYIEIFSLQPRQARHF